MSQANVKNQNDLNSNSQLNCPIDLDILERIKREAHHKKISHKVLLNRVLRDAVFKDKKSRKEDKILNHPFCPQCGFNLLNGKLKKEKDDKKIEKNKKNWKTFFCFWRNP